MKIPVDKGLYGSRHGQLTNQERISEYSVTIDREVHNDRRFARYLLSKEKREMPMDLTIGLSTFTDKSEMLDDEPCLHPMCKWATAQDGESLSEVFHGADIVSWRGTLRTIAMTLRRNDAWRIIAIKRGGLILFSEVKSYARGNAMGTYSGFKFEQLITSDHPNGEPDVPDTPVDNRPMFEIMVRSTLEVRTSEGSDKQSIGICCGAEIDALDRDDAIELKTCKKLQTIKDLATVLQSDIVGVKRVVIGCKGRTMANGREDPAAKYLVTKVIDRTLDEIKKTLHNGDKECLAFLYDVLAGVKEFMKENEICNISYSPSKNGQPKVVEVRELSPKEYQKFKDTQPLTKEFLEKFKLEPLI